MRYSIVLVLFFLLLSVNNSNSGSFSIFFNESDSSSFGIYAAFDLRERESFVQVTNVLSTATQLHIQIYDVSNLCNENNFFDLYTPNDTHTYNLREILSNDGNPSGVVLPEDAYGIIFITGETSDEIISNFRIIDNSGYEYRANSQSFHNRTPIPAPSTPVALFNFNSENGLILSDVFGIPVNVESNNGRLEATLDELPNTFLAVDVDIVDENEVLFSCRDIIFACVDENSPFLDEIIQLANNEGSSASVASYEYGINNTIPNSKDGELLCPGNVISDGVVRLTREAFGDGFLQFAGYVGLNNGNGRGSMDSFHSYNPLVLGPRG